MNSVTAISGDPAALDALAELDAERGNYKDAEAEFRRVLVLEPADVTALSNLGTLLARQGEPLRSNSAFCSRRTNETAIWAALP